MDYCNHAIIFAAVRAMEFQIPVDYGSSSLGGNMTCSQKWKKCELFCLKDRPAIWQSDHYFCCFFFPQGINNLKIQWNEVLGLFSCTYEDEFEVKRFHLVSSWRVKKLLRSCLIFCLQRRTNGFFSLTISTFKTTQKSVWIFLPHSCPWSTAEGREWRRSFSVSRETQHGSTQ